MAKSIEVTPGMFSLQESKVSLKTPIVMAFFSFVVIVAFGVLGKQSDVVFQLSGKTDLIQLDSLVVSSKGLNFVVGGVLLLITAISTWLSYSCLLYTSDAADE